MRAFIITGTSRGLGYEICKQLINRNHLIFAVARNHNDSLIEFAAQHRCKLHFVKYDLQNIDGISELIRGIMERVHDEIESITLINNAAQVTPLGNIDDCRPEDAVKSIQTNLLAPILLTQSLINQTDEKNVHRIIVNVSSGSAKDAVAGMSVYCASKAALNMFTSCIQLEDHKSLTIYKVDPGMVDTSMQEVARNQKGLAVANFFKEAKETGALKSAEDAAKKIIRRVLASQS
ncbi:SDR family NAD(P)-dependent oxidoreductase [Paenibacillus cellulositrophicus]|uniref:SDR family NAD(P)-dependent oxidoreductase n=1 Tax=Paenibacillus cellulositrophicus TaxID=562959 RepID=UPI0012673E68|nr:SDR family NAD(P)-dependent oxidoreductase [Paenibacillus cellulositrophicus]